jgi:hypothetical protein
MIFSKQKWEVEREGLEYLKISNACSWNTVKAPLRNAWDLFLVPLVGEDMAETLTEIYRQDEKTEPDKKLIRLSQRANILLAFWYDYAELNVLIGDSGFKRQESEDVRTPYKYQEKQLRDGWKTKGFNALDDLLRFLEENAGEYDDYTRSENYTQSRNAIIQNTEQANEIYFINHSRLTYLRLKPHFKIVEDTHIAPRMGDLYRQMKIGLFAEPPEEKYIGLRDMLRPVIVHYAVRRLLLETGDLSDKGLFFASLTNDDGEARTRPVADERAVHQAAQAETDALLYWKSVENYIRKNFGIEPSTGGLPRRDNRNRKAFWA